MRQLVSLTALTIHAIAVQAHRYTAYQENSQTHAELLARPHVCPNNHLACQYMNVHRAGARHTCYEHHATHDDDDLDKKQVPGSSGFY